ncbi:MULTISPECIES: cytochrome C assembly family protein [Salimicrobium]|uniref:Cytochrome C assembly protein n=1 Tax=Salimicrobium humidisoli TaxID=2029857 RepID=A0ABX4HUJ5_9BACI|nr:MULTISPECIES: cytochrome c biogenesis protein CcsA [Salimicrobium]PBB06768.1 cytochrome C assembly protein [Salimicrobium humidisoli]
MVLDLKWIYEIIILFYGLSLTGYFIDFIQGDRRANKIAFWLLGIVWTLQTVFLLSQIFIKDDFPVTTVYDGLYFYAWILVTFSLVLNRLFRVDFIIFFTNVIGFSVMIIHLMTRAQRDMGEGGVELVNEMLVVHVTLAIISYGFFTLSFIFSVLYLLQYRWLKSKKWRNRLARLGDLAKLERLSYLFIVLAVPVLLIAIVLGVVWGYISEDVFYWLDFKTVGSIIVVFVYMIWLFLKVVRGFQGRLISTYNIGAFLLLLINFFLFSSLSNFHF